MPMSNSRIVQLMFKKRGKWYCYFCGEEIKSLKDNGHWERCESYDVDIGFDEGDDSQLERVTFKFRYRSKNRRRSND